MDGLFHMLNKNWVWQKSLPCSGRRRAIRSIVNARFDDATGRLIRYRRIVGGASNSIEVNVLEYQPNSN